MRLIKVLAVLILAVLIGLVGYAYFGDMEPVQHEVRTPLAAGTGAPASEATPDAAEAAPADGDAAGE